MAHPHPVVAKISQKYPCREQVINDLYDLIGRPTESFPNAVYVFGHTGTGKTAILSAYLGMSPVKSKILSCIECYTSKLLFEHVLDTFRSHVVSKSNNYTPYRKCETLSVFIEELRLLDPNDSYLICLEDAERLRDMDVNLLPAFLRLTELTGLNICTVLVSQLPFEKFYLKSGLCEIQTVHFGQYSKAEIQTILSKDFTNVRCYLVAKLADTAKQEILESLETDFYENYLGIFLNVFYRACRDLPELRLISRDCFEIYCEPVLSGTIERNDVSKLWRHISNPLRSALAAVYMRMESSTENLPKDTFDDNQSVKRLAQTLELPYYAKYLLIAAYLASHNAAKKDKRLFVKDHGKQKKRMQTVNANAKVTEKMQTNLGPKSFSIDRLLAIFYAILDEKVGLTCNLLAQISSLVHLRFLGYVSGESNVMEGSARLQCTVGLDFILQIGKVVGFNVMQYLCDFM